MNNSMYYISITIQKCIIIYLCIVLPSFFKLYTHYNQSIDSIKKIPRINACNSQRICKRCT